MPSQRVVDNRLAAKCGADARLAKCGADARLAPGAALAAATAQREAAAEAVAKATAKAQARARHPAAVGASDVRVLALDMDGTTLNSAQQLAPRTLAALRRARAAGIEVVIATGRPAYVLQRTIDELALPGSEAAGVPCVNFNGACAMRMFPAPRPPQLLFAEALSEQTTAAALDVCEALGLCVSYTTADGATAAPAGADHERLLARFEALEGVRQQRAPAAQPGGGDGGGGGGGCCRHLLGRVPALKVIALSDTPEASAAAARAALPPGLCNVVAAEVHIEFLRADVSKGLSLRRLCGGGGGGGGGGHLGVGMDGVRAYGDNHNDVEMLRLAGQGVAMANAKDAVKALPGVRVCEWSNDKDGVAREVELLLAARAADER